MGSDNDRIDFIKLEKEFAAAVEADKKYSRENAAKFRAVEQKVGSYDEFRNIVLASNLQPLDRNDIESVNKTKQTLNPIFIAKQQTGNVKPESIDLCGDIDPKRQPETVDTFVKKWKRVSKTNPARYHQIISLSQDVFGKILSSDLVGDLLGDILIALNGCFADENAYVIANCLQCLSKNARFKLSIQFLNKNERQAIHEIMEKLTLANNGCNIDILNDVRSAFTSSR